ncbi:MAG: RNB domain-containing ribonuclease, partial [Eubacteriales bacterium]|nr:RNB domain-containing ribonuclease [Eubacteriales bacterium]
MALEINKIMDIQKTEGVFRRTKSGHGYVTIQRGDEEENIPVAVSYNSDVYDGDTVIVSVSDAQPVRREDDDLNRVKMGKILKVMERAQKTVTGEYRVSEKKPYLIPDSYIPFRIPIKQDKEAIKCRDGDKIQAEINKYKAVSAMRAIPKKNFGRADTYGANFKAAVSDTCLFTGFSQQAEKQALSIKPVEAKNFVSRRTDLRSKTIFTFTDSVFESSGCGFSVSREERGWKIGVHIADVAEYLVQGTELDAEAASRGRQILGSRDGSAMLPKSFINSVCSFNEKREFLAVSVFVDYDDMGNVTDTEFCESVIAPVLDASAADVDALISGGDSSSLIPLRRKYSAVGEQINQMYDLAALLRSKRIRNGGVDFDGCERVFGFDAEHKIRTMALKYKSDSTLMVNEIFISLGKAAAEALFYSGTSCIYTGIAEKKYDKVKGPPDDRFFMEENEYYEEGYTKKEAVVSRGTFFEKHCFETITCECETPRLALVPTPHYIYGADKYIEFFFPAEKYSDLTNLRAIKAFINEQPFDIRKAEEGTKNEEKAGLIRQSLIKIMTAGYLNDS